VAYKKKQRSCFIFLSRDKMRVHIKKSMPDNSGSWGYGMRRPCRQSPLGGLSQVRPTDEEEPHEMNQKGGGPQPPACAQLWQPSRFGISLIDPSVRYRSSYAMSILCP
jgi:hypothetical protein